MKLILLENVDNLGKMGDAIEAKDGYARNCLLPKGLALEATASNLKIVEKKKQKQQQKLDRIKQEAREAAKKLTLVSCTITMPAGEDDKLHGSVTAQDIADALEQEGIKIDKKNIVINQPINKLGIYSCEVKLHPEVTQELKVWVIKK
ncbi:MAG: 50S ribosomal protein L9 [Candidatus Omnitrophota bacterium]